MQFFFSESDIDQNIIDQIIRPPRQSYSKTDLGPQRRQVGNVQVVRQDFELRNDRNDLLCGSLWQPSNGTSRQLMIYLHGNAGSRIEATTFLQYLIPLNISVLSFDFSGCGVSQGKFVTLGCKEVLDLDCVMNYIENNFRQFQSIGLWGRSMGAVVSLLYTGQQGKFPLSQLIKLTVLDSPFSSFKKLSEEQADKKFGSGIASLFISGGIELVRKRIIKDTGFDLFSLNIVQCAQQCKQPAIFCYSIDDTLIHYSHSERLMRNYQGINTKTYFQGNHNAFRDQNYYNNTLQFIQQYFGSGQQQQMQQNVLQQSQMQVQPLQFQQQQQPNQSQQNIQQIIFNNQQSNKKFVQNAMQIQKRNNAYSNHVSNKNPIFQKSNEQINQNNRAKSQHSRIVLGQLQYQNNINIQPNQAQKQQQPQQKQQQQQQLSQSKQCKGISLLGLKQQQQNNNNINDNSIVQQSKSQGIKMHQFNQFQPQNYQQNQQQQVKSSRYSTTVYNSPQKFFRQQQQPQMGQKGIISLNQTQVITQFQ